jgi:hypothetical protein
MRALLLGLLLAACGKGEAEDPHDMIGDYPGSEGEQGAQAPADRVATQAECKAAAKRIEELALELVVKEEQDPEERTKLEQRRREELASADFASRVEAGARDCLARETTQREAACITRAINDIAIDRCGAR